MEKKFEPGQLVVYVGSQGHLQEYLYFTYYSHITWTDPYGGSQPNSHEIVTLDLDPKYGDHVVFSVNIGDIRHPTPAEVILFEKSKS